MKNFIFRRSSLYSGYFKTLSILVLVLTASSCTTEKKQDSAELAIQDNNLKLDDKDETGATFLVFAAETSMEEIELGKLAQDLSRTIEVQQLGKMMEEEHMKALTQTEDLAKQKQITLPTTMPEKGKDAYKKLSEMTGSDFDKEYSDMMVEGHKNAIDKFSQAADSLGDSEISAWANATLPTLKKHLEMAIGCQKTVYDIRSTKTTVKNN